MKNKNRIFIDQFNTIWRADSIKDLQEQIGGRVSKMYVDGKDGGVYHVGYVVGSLWLHMYTPVRVKQ